MLLEVREIAPGLLQVVGTVDLASVTPMREKLSEAVDRAVEDGMPTLSVDLHAARFSDAAGLGVLLGAHRRARRGGSSLRLVSINADLLALLHTSRLFRVLDVEPDGRASGQAHRAPVSTVPSPRDDVDEASDLTTT